MAPSRSHTKGQAITLDFVTGLFIIITALIITTTIFITNQKNSTFDETRRATITATELLMSEGYPEDWNETTIIKLGLLTNNKLNQTKLEQASNLDYEDLKTALHTKKNLYFYLKNKTTIQNITACGYGDPDITTNQTTCEPTLPQEGNVVIIERFIAHNENIQRLVVIGWD